MLIDIGADIYFDQFVWNLLNSEKPKQTTQNMLPRNGVTCVILRVRDPVGNISHFPCNKSNT